MFLSCLLTLVSLQTLLYEVAVTGQNTSDETGHFLWDVFDSRFSVTPDPDSIGQELSDQQTLQDVSRYEQVIRVQRSGQLM